MPSALPACWTLANDATFVQRVTVAVVREAVRIKANIAVDTARNQQRKSHALADRVLSSPVNGAVQSFVFAIAAKVNTPDAPTDTDINQAVGNLWTSIAGVGPGELD